MSDNVTLPGTGAVVRTDDIGGVQFPVSKLTIGADGTDDGLVSSANPLPVEIIGAPTLPTGAASEATLAGVLSTIAFQARMPVLGQALRAASVPVTLASDQPTIPVSLASVPIATGAALDATVASVATALAGTLAVSAAALPLPAGAATESTLGGLLTTTAFQARVATLGQKAMAGSMPVVFASDQSALPVSGTVAVSGTVPVSSTQLPTLVSSRLPTIGTMGIPAHDYVERSYTGDRLDSMVFKSGGSGGTTVATLTFGYTGDNLTSTTKS